MDQFRPHLPSAAFEGYYSKFTLPSGAHIVLIICSVPKATHKPHMVSFTYVPPDFPQTPCFQQEIWVENIEMINHSPSTATINTSSPSTPSTLAFELRIPKVGTMQVHTDDTTTYTIHDPSNTFTFTAHIAGASRLPWTRKTPTSTPEGLLIHLPLPLHWHVHSLASKATIDFTITPTLYSHLPMPIPTPTQETTSLVHQEKNWAHSFPTSHIWIQAHNPQTNTSLSIAGGAILHTNSYLLTYHAVNPAHDMTFTPPYTTAPAHRRLSHLSPTLRATHTWTETSRAVTLSISSLTRRIEVEASAAPGSFIGLSAPFHDGHRGNFLGQSFGARVVVRVYWATWFGFGHWERVAEEVFEGAGLEFGGEVYGSVEKGRDIGENEGRAWVC